MGLQNLQFQEQMYARGSQAIANAFQKLRELDDRKKVSEWSAELQQKLANLDPYSVEAQKAIADYSRKAAETRFYDEKTMRDSAKAILETQRLVEAERRRRQEEAYLNAALQRLGSNYLPENVEQIKQSMQSLTPDEKRVVMPHLKTIQDQEKLLELQGRNQLRAIYAGRRPIELPPDKLGDILAGVVTKSTANSNIGAKTKELYNSAIEAGVEPTIAAYRTISTISGLYGIQVPPSVWEDITRIFPSAAYSEISREGRAQMSNDAQLERATIAARNRERIATLKNEVNLLTEAVNAKGISGKARRELMEKIKKLLEEINVVQGTQNSNFQTPSNINVE